MSLDRDIMSLTIGRQLITVLCLLCLVWATVSGQSIEISQDIQMKSNTNYDLIGQYQGGIQMIEDNGKGLKIVEYDEKMQVKNTHEINLNQKRAYIKGYVPRDSQLSVYYTWLDTNGYKLNLANYDYKGRKQNDTTIFLYEGRTTNLLPVIVSKSKEQHLLKIPQSDRSMLYIQVTPQTLTKNWIQVYQPHNSGLFFEKLLSHVLTENGTYYLLTGLDRNRRNEDYKIHRFDASAVNFKSLTISDVFIDDIKMFCDAHTRSVYVVGIYSTNLGSGQEGIVLNRIGHEGLDIQPSLYFTFLSKTYKDLHGKDETRKSGVFDFELKDAFFRNDGGFLLMCEQTKEVSRYNSPGRNPFLPANTSTDYYIEDVLLTSFDGQQNMEWQKILKKKQQSYDDDAVFSSFFIHANGSALRLLFNDEIKFENTVSEYIINPLGKIERRVLLNTAGNNLHLQMRNGVQLDANTSLLPSVFKGKLRLIKLKY